MSGPERRRKLLKLSDREGVGKMPTRQPARRRRYLKNYCNLSDCAEKVSPLSTPVAVIFQLSFLSVLAMRLLAVSLDCLSNLMTLLSSVRMAYPDCTHSAICRQPLSCLAAKPGSGWAA